MENGVGGRPGLNGATRERNFYFSSNAGNDGPDGRRLVRYVRETNTRDEKSQAARSDVHDTRHDFRAFARSRELPRV